MIKCFLNNVIGWSQFFKDPKPGKGHTPHLSCCFSGWKGILHPWGLVRFTGFVSPLHTVCLGRSKPRIPTRVLKKKRTAPRPLGGDDLSSVLVFSVVRLWCEHDPHLSRTNHETSVDLFIDPEAERVVLLTVSYNSSKVCFILAVVRYPH